MKKQYIVPIVGQIYTNRNGGEYRCTGNLFYENDAQRQRSVSLGEHVSYMERVKDGWRLTAHGVIEYEDGTIEWNYSTGGHFPR